MRIPIALGAVAVLSACASSPNDISTAYVSELQYKDYSCEQVEMERTRVSQRADDLHASLKKTADNDTAQMAVGMILLWPVLFFLEGGDGPEAQEYSRLKGEAQALEKVAITKSCNLAPPPQPEYHVRQGGGLPDEEPQFCCPTKGQVARSFNAPDGGQDESDTGIALASASKSYNPPISSIPGATTKALNSVGSGVQDASYTLAAGAIWEAGGSSDGCGVPWRINVQQFGTEIRGNLWWMGMSYDLYGDIDDRDRALDAFASKSAESQNMPGPSKFNLEFDLKQNSATGHYAIDNQSKACRTDFVLSRS